MKEEKQELMQSELTDEELGEVVGGAINWNAVLKYIQREGPKNAQVELLVAAIYDKNHKKALDLAIKLSVTGVLPDIKKYMLG